MGYELRKHKEVTILNSPNYNYHFNRSTGLFYRWGKTYEKDPALSPYGPEILDLEISSGGDCLGNCPWCYKANGGNQPTKNMSFDTFKEIFDKMPPVLTQIAFGIMNISTNPDFFKMMEYSRDNHVVPNYTCHGLDVTPEAAIETARICGAVSVSLYNRKKTFDAIKLFTDAGMKQVNIHFLLARETFFQALTLLEEAKEDSRLDNLNAIIFLHYKPKGKNPDMYHPIQDDQLSIIIERAKKIGIAIGFDSCSAPKVLKVLPDQELFIEPCESFLFSSYCNVDGEFFPCSFIEGEEGWKEGISALESKDFLADIWFHPIMRSWRRKLICNNRKCPIFDLGDK